MNRRLLLIALFLSTFCLLGHAIPYNWNGSVSSDWTNSANWTPMGVPGPADDVTIGPIATPNAPQMPGGFVFVSNLNILNASLDMNGSNLIASAATNFILATVTNGGTVISNVIGIVNSTFDADTYEFEGNRIGQVAGSTFNGPVTLIKGVSSGSDSWQGGNTFNSFLEVTNESAWDISMAGLNADVFNGDVTFNSAPGEILVAREGDNTFAGDITITGTMVKFGMGATGTVVINGNSPQDISGSSMVVSRLQMNSAAGGSLTLGTTLSISEDLEFTNGIINSDPMNGGTRFVNFADNATATGASDASHVDGGVTKTGDDAFTFPVGNGGLYGGPSMSAPSVTTHSFRAQYIRSDPNALGTPGGSLDHVSTLEYWVFERTIGNSKVDFGIPWNSNSGGVDDIPELVMARNVGTNWQEVNGSTASGTPASGVVTITQLNNFGNFTLASTNGNNPLPIELLYFNATARDYRSVELTWATLTETDNEYFVIERSTDGKGFEAIGEQIPGAGTSFERLDYTVMDKAPLPGLSYYRLKQVDFDGQYSYSDVRAVQFDGKAAAGDVSVWPNPARGAASVRWPGITGQVDLRVFNMMGQRVPVTYTSNDNGQLDINLGNLPAGTYNLLLNAGGESRTERLIIQD